MNRTIYFFKLLGLYGVFVGTMVAMLFVSSTQVYGQTVNNLIDAPTLLTPNLHATLTDPKPLIAGVTKNDTNVDVYIDGIFNGRAVVKNNINGTASWAYRPFLPLSIGAHTIYTVARSKDELLRSVESAPNTITIAHSIPTPILLGLTLNKNSAYNKPFITGLVKNGLSVDIIINQALDGSITPQPHESGTANFAYQPKNLLLPGWYTIALQAKHSDGRISVMSTPLVFEVRENDFKPQNQVITTTSVQQKYPTNVSTPTLIQPTDALVTTNTKPDITGISKNNQIIEIFIDGDLNGEARVVDHQTRVSSFSYKPFLPLHSGIHTIQARAIDAQSGEKGNFTQIHTIVVRSPQNHFVVSPRGIQNLAVLQPKAITTATSTQPRISKDSTPQQTTEDITVTPTQHTEPENKTPEPQVTTVVETQQPNTNIAVVDTHQEPDIVVTNTTTIPATTSPILSDESGTQKTGLIIALALAAIIIIGLVSWFTSNKEGHIITSENTTAQTPTAQDTPPLNIQQHGSQKTDNTLWETEPTELFDYQGTQDEEWENLTPPEPPSQSPSIPPPPPPPPYSPS